MRFRTRKLAGRNDWSKKLDFIAWTLTDWGFRSRFWVSALGYLRKRLMVNILAFRSIKIASVAPLSVAISLSMPEIELLAPSVSLNEYPGWKIPLRPLPPQLLPHRPFTHLLFAPSPPYPFAPCPFPLPPSRLAPSHLPLRALPLLPLAPSPLRPFAPSTLRPFDPSTLHLSPLIFCWFLLRFS